MAREIGAHGQDRGDGRSTRIFVSDDIGVTIDHDGTRPRICCGLKAPSDFGPQARQVEPAHPLQVAHEGMIRDMKWSAHHSFTPDRRHMDFKASVTSRI